MKMVSMTAMTGTIAAHPTDISAVMCSAGKGGALKHPQQNGPPKIGPFESLLKVPIAGGGSVNGVFMHRQCESRMLATSLASCGVREWPTSSKN